MQNACLQTAGRHCAEALCCVQHLAPSWPPFMPQTLASTAPQPPASPSPVASVASGLSDFPPLLANIQGLRIGPVGQPPPPPPPGRPPGAGSSPVPPVSSPRPRVGLSKLSESAVSQPAVRPVHSAPVPAKSAWQVPSRHLVQPVRPRLPEQIAVSQGQFAVLRGRKGRSETDQLSPTPSSPAPPAAASQVAESSQASTSAPAQQPLVPTQLDNRAWHVIQALAAVSPRKSLRTRSLSSVLPRNSDCDIL